MVILVIVSHFTGESQVVIFFAEDSIIGRLTTLVFFYSWLIMVQRIADFKEKMFMRKTLGKITCKHDSIL